MNDQAYLEDERPAPARRRSRNVLPVRMLVAKVGWLDGLHRWRSGSVYWDAEAGSKAPGPADLSRAQRSLNKLRQYPIAARQALGDVDQWLALRQSRLELAKRLGRVTEGELQRLADLASSGKSLPHDLVIATLAAEALCINGLPVTPSQILVACGDRALPAVDAALPEGSLPGVVRALAAMTRGALLQYGRNPSQATSALPPDPWLRRAERWGQRYGVSSEPALTAALLEKDENTAERVLRTLNPHLAFALEPEMLREQLALGASPACIVDLAEAVAAAQPVAELLTDHRHLLPEIAKERRPAAIALDEHAAETVETLRHLFEQYARSTRDPGDIRAAVDVARGLLALGVVSKHTSNALYNCLQRGLRMPRALQGEWLRLLIEEQEWLWRAEQYPSFPPGQMPELLLQERMDICWEHRVTHAATLLERFACPALVRNALKLDLQNALIHVHSREVDTVRLVLSIGQEFSPQDCRMLFWDLEKAVGGFASAGVARAAMEPLLVAIRRVPESGRADLFGYLLEACHTSGRNNPEAPAKLARYIPLLLKFHAEGTEWTFSRSATETALALNRAIPDRAEEWLSQLLDAVSSWARADSLIAQRLECLDVVVKVGLAIAGENQSGFLSVVRGGLASASRYEERKLRAGLQSLAKLSGIRAALAAAFPHQPHRCFGLIVRFGLSSRLGADALSSITSLAEGANELDLSEADEVWHAVLALSPELRPLLASYQHSLTLCGRPLTLPSGIRRALTLPERLAAELAHLEARATSNTVPAHIVTRIQNLRSRLADTGALRAAVCAEVVECLTLAVHEISISALELLVDRCFRARLEQVAGPLPEDLVMDEDWLNAALLSVGIEQNKHLLRRLLRGCIEGDRRWPERHPENVRFIQSLAERGVDAAAWLGVHPRRYQCEAASGGWVHLRLERDPLRIMQMGNYFDTCLANDGCNSFSSIANACELNKRVMYVTDDAGRVVGRKLIALSEIGQLVGFHTYTSLSSSAANEAVTAIVRDYLGRFAAQCNLELGECGPVPRLFAEAWYDDGIVGWETPAINGVQKAE